MTPAIELLNKQNIPYVVHEYDHDASSQSYGMEAAQKLGLDAAQVFKTLVVIDDKGKLFVGMVSVAKQLNLKMLAASLKVKKLTMADKRLVERTSGYVVGGVSPLGQKKPLPTVIDEEALLHERIYISGGKRGLDLEVAPQDLVRLLGAVCAKITA